LAKALKVTTDDVLESVRASQAVPEPADKPIAQSVTLQPGTVDDRQQKPTGQDNICDLAKEQIGTIQQRGSEVDLDLGRRIIGVEEEKLHIRLMTALKNMERKREWTAPLGVFFTASLAVTSATFRSFLSIDGSTWKAFFMLSAIGSLCWFIVAVIKSLKSKSVEELIEYIKHGPPPYRGRPARSKFGGALAALLRRIAQVIEFEKANESSGEDNLRTTDSHPRLNTTGHQDREILKKPVE
jgi:hypothetical protein